MIIKNKLFFINFFKYIIFINKKISFKFYIIDKFQFLLPINNFYFKWKPLPMYCFNKFFLKTYSIHWFRVSFKGKGYRLRKFKKLNKLTLNFGHSHWAKLMLNPTSFFFKKIKRQNYLCFMKNFFLYKNMKFSFKFFKKINSYTKRGLRLKKQFINRRFGKISQVVSSLH